MMGKRFLKPEPDDAASALPQESEDLQSPDAQAVQAEQPQQEQDQAAEAQPGRLADIAGMLSNHKGKLAVGAAAMLGVAVFYKWREGRLAKEDPEEYARLQRLKKAIDSGAIAPDEDKEAGKPE